ncbi:MAG: GTP-binding protein [Methylococcales bacterium]|nr:GTP-binding protein [Methylococcales bacterium]
MSDLDVIKKIENLIGEPLTPGPADSDITYWDQQNTFLLNSQQQVTGLNIRSNGISDISVLEALTNLTRLDLSHNQISELPECLVNLNIPILWKNNYRNGIFLENNPLEEPPPEIIDLGNEAIKAYFNGGERKAINEIKIILVGDGSSGKTSLSKVLRGEDFDEHENQTHGINIYKKEIAGVSVNYWDFGGQEMMHSTHQFFLSSRSLYVLVLDGRKEEDAEYWLKYIESFGGNSPVLIVLNKIDQHPSFDVNRKFLQEKYSGIHGFYKLSCQNKEGIGQLKNGIQEAFKKVPLIRSKLPKTWFEVKSQLENMPLNKNFINYQAFRDLCEQQQIKDSATQDILSRYLNDLGVIIHFTDPKLISIPVLKPRWITQAIYKIINFKSVAEAHGIFNLTHLSSVLATITEHDFDYPRETHSYIIELMLKFEICYQVDNDTILIPDLLEIQEPDFEFDNESSEILRFRIRYDFLPLSIMPRFIVRLHHDIKNHFRWRTGVILEDKNLDALAIVKVDYKDKLINIVVSGTQKRDYFATIRKTFTDIHDSFEKLGVVELVPLPDNPNQEVKYKALLGFEKARKDDYFDGESGLNYSVSTLLNGIEKPESRRKEGDTYIYAQEVNMSKRTIEIGQGNYNEGSITNSNVSAGDINIQNNQGMGKAEFLQLLQTFKQDLSKSGLPDDTVEEVISDIDVVEKQLQKLEPNKSTVSRRLESINGVLEDANSTIDTATKGYDTVNNLLALGAKLVAGFAGIDF